MFDKIKEYADAFSDWWDDRPPLVRFLIVAGGAWALGRLDFPWLF